MDHFAKVQWQIPTDQLLGEKKPQEEAVERLFRNETGEPKLELDGILAEKLTETKRLKPTEGKQKASTPLTKLPSPKGVKVQVLNGCDVRGLAAKVRGVLRERGFDVMSIGNARRQNYSKSLVIVRSKGNFAEQAAEVLARSLGVSNEQIRVDRDPALVDIDVTLILGMDYGKLNLGKE